MVGEEAVGRAAVVTIEELLVFAAGHDLPLPPGGPHVAEALDADDSGRAVLEHAARALVARGVTLAPDGPVPGDPGLQALLTATCGPRTRIAVDVGGPEGSGLRAQVFSIAGGLAVVQGWDDLGLHYLYGRRTEEILDIVLGASALELVGAVPGVGGASAVEMTVDAERLSQAATAGQAALDALVREAATGAEIGADDLSAIGEVVAGRTAGSTVLFNGSRLDPPWTAVVSWFSPGPDGAWLIGSEGPEQGERRTVSISRVGSTQIRDLLTTHYRELVTAS